RRGYGGGAPRAIRRARLARRAWTTVRRGAAPLRISPLPRNRRAAPALRRIPSRAVVEADRPAPRSGAGRGLPSAPGRPIAAGREGFAPRLGWGARRVAVARAAGMARAAVRARSQPRATGGAGAAGPHRTPRAHLPRRAGR